MTDETISKRGASVELIVVVPNRTARNYWSDLWRYRELFVILAWRDISVRYKQTVIGVSWAIIRPLLTVLVLSTVFGGLAGLPSDGAIPYSIMVFAGTLPWFLFSNILSDGSNSLVSNSQLIGKIYFPRIIVPVSNSIVPLVDFLISFFMFCILLFWFHLIPDWRIFFLPFFIILAVFSGLGPALFFSSLNIRYRDFRIIIPFLMQLGLYATPVGFSSDIVPEKWRLLYSLNPAVGVIDGFRWSLLAGQSNINISGLILSVCVCFFFLIVGFVTFRTMERTFADVI